MKRTSAILLLTLLAFAIALPAMADPGKPNFGEALYADGELWGTKVTNAYEKMNGSDRAWDKFFIITADNTADLPPGQKAVGEAAPGNPEYSGGRWWTWEAHWNADGISAHGTPLPLLTSYDDVMLHAGLGHIDLTAGSPDFHPDYFHCPLLPVK